MSTADLVELTEALPEGVVVTDAALMEKYRSDHAQVPPPGLPLAVVRAESTRHVEVAMRWASQQLVSVVTRGAGTGLSGGARTVDGCLVVSLERMRGVRVDPATRTAVAAPGALNAEVKAAAAVHGLWYPPDPSSFEICSIGGNVATNAGGLCCVKYGVTRDYVLGLEVVLADGSVVRLGGPRLKDAAGLSLTQMFVGSEGTLGIVTEVTLRLLPRQPAMSTLMATFATTEHAVAAVLAMVSASRPAMLEYMDRVSVNAVEDLLRIGLDRKAAAVLIAGSDGGEPEFEAMVAACEAQCATEVLSTSDPAEGEALMVARRSVLAAMERLGGRLLIEDVGVPLPQLPALVSGIEAIGAQRQTTISLIAHAGDGNTHPQIVFDPTDAGAAARADEAFGEIMELAIALGGTITGEHGIGRLKQPWLAAQLGPDAIALSERIKHALDPLGILNPGVIFR